MHNRLVPRNFGWCGGDRIVGYCKNQGVLMLSPLCEYLRFDYDSY